MEQNLVVTFDGDPVRFTPDGEVSVLNAIGALTHSERAGVIWEDVKRKHPEIASFCGAYSFQKGLFMPVVDKEGWERLWILLIDYLGE